MSAPKKIKVSRTTRIVLYKADVVALLRRAGVDVPSTAVLRVLLCGEQSDEPVIVEWEHGSADVEV